MAPTAVPRWFLLTGWVMIVVGAAGLVHDLIRLGEVSAASSTFELLLDAFLLVAGAVVVVVTRRARR